MKASFIVRLSMILGLYTFLAANVANADTLYFKNGDVLNGTIKQIDYEKNELVFVGADDKITSYNLDKIKTHKKADGKIAQGKLFGQEPIVLQDIYDFSEPLGFALRGSITSLGYSIYDASDDDEDIDARLLGLDFAGQFYFNNYLFAELGVYQGTTTKAWQDGDSISLDSILIDVDRITVTGARAELLGGYNVRKHGAKMYAGLGAYTERLKTEQVLSDSSENLSGIALKIGGGYTVPEGAIDAWISFKSDEPQGFESDSSQVGVSLTYFLP